MVEIEIKVIDIEPEEIIKKLLALGATPVFDGELVTSFFDFQDQSLERSRSLLRLRRRGEEVLLAFKTFVGNEGAKVMNEEEVGVEDYELMERILQGIGLRERKRMKKRRQSFRLGGVAYDLDTYKEEFAFVPPFIEIEGASGEEVSAAADMLALPQESRKAWSTTDLIEHYRKKVDG